MNPSSIISPRRIKQRSQQVRKNKDMPPNTQDNLQREIRQSCYCDKHRSQVIATLFPPSPAPYCPGSLDSAPKLRSLYGGPCSLLYPKFAQKLPPIGPQEPIVLVVLGRRMNRASTLRWITTSYDRAVLQEEPVGHRTSVQAAT